MGKTARCLFSVVATHPAYKDAPEGTETVQMMTQYNEPLTKDERAFSTSTPWGTLNFGLQNPALAGFFKPGKKYYLDITEAEE